jgi:hypothetical protein
MTSYNENYLNWLATLLYLNDFGHDIVNLNTELEAKFVEFLISVCPTYCFKQVRPYQCNVRHFKIAFRRRFFCEFLTSKSCTVWETRKTVGWLLAVLKTVECKVPSNEESSKGSIRSPVGRIESINPHRCTQPVATVHQYYWRIKCKMAENSDGVLQFIDIIWNKQKNGHRCKQYTQSNFTFAESINMRSVSVSYYL